MITKIKYLIFFLLLTTVIVTFFTKGQYKNVGEIVPEVRQKPIQNQLDDLKTVTFTKNDYEYKAKPLYNYELNGLVVHETDYKFFSLYKMDSVFPADLCVIWGDNVEEGVYKDPSLTFSQDMRFCFVRWRSNVGFNIENMSNNHLVVSDNDEVEKKIKSIRTGDQIKITGKLVDIEAKNLAEAGQYDPPYFEWKSSTSREDTGAGACETILVEDIQILKRENSPSQILFTISLYVLIAYTIINIILAFVNPFSRSEEEEEVDPYNI